MRLLSAFVVVVAVACGPVASSDFSSSSGSGPRARVAGVSYLHHGEALTQGGTIPYNGGAVLLHPSAVNLYWGTYWQTAAGQAEQAVLDGLAQGMAGTPWLGILSQYGDANGNAPDVIDGVFGGSQILATDPPSLVQDGDIQAFVEQQLQTGVVPYGAETVYFVYTGPGVTVQMSDGSQSCNQWCGYHNHYSGNSGDTKYSPIPHGDCPQGCGAPGLTVNSAGLDQSTTTMSHEFAEAVTDPDLSAYTGGNLGEVGDPCTAAFSASWGNASYAVQTVWSNATQSCVQQ